MLQKLGEGFHETLWLLSHSFFTSVRSFSLYHHSNKSSQGFVFSALKRQATWRGHNTVNERMMFVLPLK